MDTEDEATGALGSDKKAGFEFEPPEALALAENLGELTAEKMALSVRSASRATS